MKYEVEPMLSISVGRCSWVTQ